MVETVGVGRITQLTGGIVGYVPHLGDLPQRPVPQPNPGGHNIVSTNSRSVLVIPRGRQTEVIVVLDGYALAALSIHAVKRGEESGRVYGPFVERKGGYGIVRQGQHAGVFCEEINPIVSSDGKESKGIEGRGSVLEQRLTGAKSCGRESGVLVVVMR